MKNCVCVCLKISMTSVLFALITVIVCSKGLFNQIPAVPQEGENRFFFKKQFLAETAEIHENYNS